MAETTYIVRRPAVAGTLLQIGSGRRRGQAVRSACKAEIGIADHAAVVGELLASAGAAVIIPRAELERIDSLAKKAQAAIRRAERMIVAMLSPEQRELLFEADDALVELLKGPQ